MLMFYFLFFRSLVQHIDSHCDNDNKGIVFKEVFSFI